MKTLEANKLIAEFMNLETQAATGRIEDNCFKYDVEKFLNLKTKSWDTVTCVFPSEFRFDEEWNWIMPVVNQIAWRWTYLDEDEEPECYRLLFLAVTNVEIESVYIHAVEFIEWYNKNKKG